MINSKTKVVALIGYPSRHSFSPIIQNHFISENNKNAVYLVFEFKPDKFIQSFNGIKNLGFIGLNVTMPYKMEVYKRCTYLDTAARETRSVNTVKFAGEEKIEGYNTDVYGLLKSLDDYGFGYESKNCLILGAGGAARSAIFALLGKSVNNIFIYNRTTKKAKKVKKLYRKHDREKIGIIQDLGEINPDKIDLIINCTPVGMETGEGLKEKLPVPRKWNLHGKFIFDMVYKPVNTNLVKKAKNEGAKAISGLDMLVNQAAFSFKIWFNIKKVPQTSMITEKIKKIILTGEKI